MKTLTIILTFCVGFSLNLQINFVKSAGYQIFIDRWLKIDDYNQITYATSSVNFTNYNGIFLNHHPHTIYNFNESNRFTNEFQQIKYKNYIIIDRNWNSLNRTIYNLLQMDDLNVHGKYLVIIEDLLKAHNIADIFHFLFKQMDVYNVILFNNNKFYTWYPYKDNCNENISIHEIDGVDLLKNFQNKLPKQLNGCPVRAIWSKATKIINDPFNHSDPGSIVILMNEIGYRCNATIVYLKENNIDTRIMDVQQKSYDSLHEDMKRLNVTLSIYVRAETPHRNLRYSHNIFHDTYGIILLPSRRRAPKWTEFKIFTDDMIVSVIISLLGCSFGLALLTKRSFLFSLFRIYQLSFQLSLNLSPTTWKLRIYFIFLLFFVMEISSAYLSGLSSVFTRPTLEPRIRTVQQFLDSDLVLKSYKYRIDWLKNLDEKKVGRVWPQWKFIAVDNVPFADQMNDFFRYQSYAMTGYAPIGSIISPYSQQLVRYTGRSPVAFLFRKRGHLNDLIDRYVLNIDEKGVNNYFTYLSLMSSEKYAFTDPEYVVQLIVDDLSGVFIIWLIGLGAATVVFVLEHIYKNNKRRLRQWRLRIRRNLRNLRFRLNLRIQRYLRNLRDLRNLRILRNLRNLLRQCWNP